MVRFWKFDAVSADDRAGEGDRASPLRQCQTPRSRVLSYVFTYLGNRPTLRTILWSIGFAINLGIFFMPAIRGYLPI